MKQTIDQILQQLEAFRPGTLAQVEEFRVHMLGKKGMLTRLFEDFKHVDPAQKRELGQLLNQLKTRVQDVVKTHRTQLEQMQQGVEQADDLTKPAHFMSPGSRHPIALVLREILDIYAGMGFSIAEGPEIEDDRHVFSALNFPPDHPARDMQDTFFIYTATDNPILLRTHTSSVQVRTMETQKPPIRVVCPGRVFRNEAISARAHCIFHQVEGLYIDE
ncbi:MAG: phenylalanine--tRNA ligase subunit alpha, partial [Bacteroidales bacterium]